MERGLRSWFGSATALALALGAAACAPIGSTIEDARSPAGRTAYVSGEIQSIDSRSSRIAVREGFGRNRTLHVDRRTRVVYRQRSYPVSSLQRGDLVRVRVAYDRNGRAWADQIEVRESARDRGRQTARVQRVDGRVNWIDHRRGSFGVTGSRGGSATVYLPRDASRSDQARFHRLGRGDRIRADVRLVARDRYELVRFR
jgi:hypothetical protein